MPLEPSDYIARLQVVSLKERAEQMRLRYNRGYQECQAVRAHLDVLSEHDYVCLDVDSQVRKQLDEIEKRNEKLKAQYFEIVAFAEKYHAEGMAKKTTQQLKEAEELMDSQQYEEIFDSFESTDYPHKENEVGSEETQGNDPNDGEDGNQVQEQKRTQRTVSDSSAKEIQRESMAKPDSKGSEDSPKPIDNQGQEKAPDSLDATHNPQMENAASTQTRAAGAGNTQENASEAGEDRSDLDPMIARMKALRCRQETSALYQKRLLALLPLIRNGADVDMTLPETKGNTALHYACGIGSWSITQWLVKHGANVNAQTNKGKTPLDCVGDDNAKRIRELLISHGAKKSSELPSEGNSASGANAPTQDAEELNSLGLDYQYGKHGKTKNRNEAARHFRLAAEQGHAGAQNNLGFCYHNGWGVPKDMTQAAMWYKRSADQGNAWGQSNYGTCLEFGWGVEKDIPSAIEMYRKSAAQGHASAKKHLKRHGIAM